VVVFETMPRETWPRWYQEPNEEWLPAGLGLAELVKDLADVCQVVLGGERKYTFVNAGSIDAEFLGLPGVGPKDMERKVEKALRGEMRERWKMSRRMIADFGSEGIVDENDLTGDASKMESDEQEKKWLGSVRFELMESWVEEGMLEPAVREGWMRE